ncbi:FdtA/QdtA family cupin domain-containing protein [Vibrio fluvialis]|uniref:sugar 3,4-ketoisomerase n=1 Tax=Vibrio fluvialis TaxID=676 RepID=UPI0015589784|nr:FdtA/QdtA family cupin domain-containing protein [Vibrio fluvialis]EKO3369858.1 FdtA/QdtA family cupin domain-containing protein [Vibrio fluvialis]EKO3387388.1 FdtA/QdtA family cupin domain-containing protein [Vibrio fluvialis]EKO3418146.1 FdtA/QdtA family cupin domain-containing protein [Vibrio fluvialis]EKO3550813.1 FdtA/QdtA family cupin domain-containing protein [Vibrio fluvialis]EKO3555758.1 FdtA/QdtA family cupin domain-containing protein [Vibrio fluvialis]
MSLIKWIEFQSLGDERGELISLEGKKNIPFTIKRIYYLFGMKADIPRGFHAHKRLKQVAICVKGSCDILMDDGIYKETVSLNSPNKGLVIDVMQWHEMRNFSDDCLIIVLASDLYDEDDYIRDYSVFKRKVS